jgi:microcompartment protein CcmK/EutM
VVANRRRRGESAAWSAPSFHDRFAGAEGRRLLLCDLLDSIAIRRRLPHLCRHGGSGAGRRCHLDENSRQVIGMAEAPIRAVVVGIVDELIADGESLLV